MANKIEIDVVAKDLASAALDIVKEKLTSMGGKFGMVGAAALIMGAAVVTGLAKAVNMAQEYDQKVYDMMLTTRGTAEETSKLIQVVDDTGVSYETLKTAMKMAVKNGIQPNIESMADLADQYKALKDPVKQGQLLLDNFGKSGLEMARVMEMGGDALRKMSGEMSGGLILTQANIDASEEYRKNLDTLQDTVDGVAVSIGNELIPVLNDTFTVMDNSKDAVKESVKWYEYLIPALRGVRTAYILLKEAQQENNWEGIKAADVTAAHGDALDGFIISIEGVTISLDEQAAAAKATSDANRNLLTLTKDIQKETDNYKYAISDLNIKQYELSLILADLEAKGKTNTQMYRDTQAAMDANKKSVAELSEEHEAAMKKIAVDLYVAKLMADGFTEQEYKMAIQAMTSAGIIDKATAEMALGMDAAMNAAINAKDAVVTLGGKAKELAGDYFMNFIATLTINTRGGGGGVISEPGPDAEVIIPDEDPGTGGDYGGARASGGSVYAGRAYMVGEVGREMFVPNQNGTIIPNNELGSGGMTVNLTYAPAFSTASQTEFVNNITPMLDAWYRKAKRS